MALVHDLAESIVGDLTPSCNVSKEEKYKREKVSKYNLFNFLYVLFGATCFKTNNKH